jgi:hypothetical protein
VTANVKHYKFQALIRLYPDGDEGSCARLEPAPRRMVLRGLNAETHRSQVFSALVSCDDGGPFRPGSDRVLATLRLVGDDVPDYVGIGGHFDLLLGRKIGEGVITRRLFT